MLGTRILTAIVLLVVLLPTLFLGSPGVFAGVVGLFAAAGMWEWARLAGWRGARALLWAVAWLALVAVAAGAGFVARTPGWVFVAAALAWTVLLAGSLPRAGLPRLMAGRTVLALLGMVITLACWLALVRARALGAGFLLSVLMVAWVADVAAYFGGRAFGGAKLAPRVSPGKTRAGVYVAAAAVLVYAVTCMTWLPLRGTIAARIAGVWGTIPALFIMLILMGFTVMGDLFESLLKRHAGVKDSSGLLPGHGGVLDRIDALLPLLPFAMLVVTLTS